MQNKPLRGMARPARAAGPRSPRAGAGLNEVLACGAVWSRAWYVFLRCGCGPPHDILCGLGVYFKPALSIQIMEPNECHCFSYVIYYRYILYMNMNIVIKTGVYIITVSIIRPRWMNWLQKMTSLEEKKGTMNSEYFGFMSRDEIQ